MVVVYPVVVVIYCCYIPALYVWYSFIHQLGVHHIGVFREEESYKSLKLAMSDICAEVEDLELLTVAGETFQVNSYSLSNNA